MTTTTTEAPNCPPKYCLLKMMEFINSIPLGIKENTRNTLWPNEIGNWIGQPGQKQWHSQRENNKVHFECCFLAIWNQIMNWKWRHIKSYILTIWASSLPVRVEQQRDHENLWPNEWVTEWLSVSHDDNFRNGSWFVSYLSLLLLCSPTRIWTRIWTRIDRICSVR